MRVTQNLSELPRIGSTVVQLDVKTSARLTTLLCIAVASLVACGAPANAQNRAASPAARASEASRPAINKPGVARKVAPPGLYDPVADPRAVVRFGNARFTVLTSRLIRMEWAADGKFEDHASFVFLNRNLPVPKFTFGYEEMGAQQDLTIETDALKLKYTPTALKSGQLAAENLEIDFTLNGQPVVWHPGMADTGNLQGTTRTLDGAEGDQTREPIGPGLVSRGGWTMVDDSQRPLFDSADFSFTEGEASAWPWVIERPAGDRQDWYFFGYGHDYKAALGDFVRVAGRIPLPPRFAFGVWWSRYWAYSDQELDDLVHDFRANDVPLDVLVIDMDWHPTFGVKWWENKDDASGHTLGWSGYSWNHLLFPDPGDFLKKLHTDGLKVTLNVHPASGIQPWEDHYPEMAKAMGIDPATKQYVPFDITDKKFATNYMDLIHHPLERQGIDFWWLDWQQEANTKEAGVNPTWWLNYVHFSDQAREGKRPLLFHRWGGLGNHRYEIGFSGDAISVWDSLAFQPWFTATAANVGYAYWSHDIGGHMPGVVDAELFTRWVQFGAFSPILRTHTTKNPDSERRIWAYPEPYSNILRDTYHLRYALQPYIYTEARRTYDTGVAFLRPLYYDWPEADEAYGSKNEYVFGENMIAAPIVNAADPATQLAGETIWLPPGDWIEWPTGKHFSGPVKIQRNFSIRQISVYVRAGAIVPMEPEMRYTGEKPVDPLIVNVFPLADGQSSSYTLYEDASNTRAYESGEAAWTALHASRAGNDVTVEIKPLRGAYPGMPRARGIEVRLPGDWPPGSVTVNGAALRYAAKSGAPGWRYEGNTLTTVITLARIPVSSRVVVRVHRDAALVAREAELDGFAGLMTRLHEAYDSLNQTWPLGWTPDTLVDAMQTGDRLTYRPQTAGAELMHLRGVLQIALAAVQEMAKPMDEAAQRRVLEIVGGDAKSPAALDRIKKYQQVTARALAQVEDATPAAAPTNK
ncbi:MAG: TIM-barrel domain-containing protein [Candidatus Acidiferrales bacterium]|jgi:alpha-glucosidase